MGLRKSVDSGNAECFEDLESSDVAVNTSNMCSPMPLDISSCLSDSRVEPPSSLTSSYESLNEVQSSRSNKINVDLHVPFTSPVVDSSCTVSNDKHSIQIEPQKNVLKETKFTDPILIDQDLDMDFSCIPKELKESLASVDMQPNDNRTDLNKNQADLKVPHSDIVGVNASRAKGNKLLSCGQGGHMPAGEAGKRHIPSDMKSSDLNLQEERSSLLNLSSSKDNEEMFMDLKEFLLDGNFCS